MIVYDRVKEQTVTTGPGPLLLAGPDVGFQPFATIGDGAACFYAVDDGAGAWEVGQGTWHATGDTLSRDAIFSSSNGNAAVSFGPGTKTVWLDAPAAFLNDIPNANLAHSEVTISGNVLPLGGSLDLARQDIAGLGLLAGLDSYPAVGLTGPTLAPNVVNSSLTSVGTLAAGSIPFSLLTGVPAAGPAAAGTLTGPTLAPNVVNSSLTSVGTLAAGSIPFSLLTGVPAAGPAAAGTLTGPTLAPNVVNSSLTSVGTLAAGAIPFSLLTGVPAAGPAAAGTLTGPTLAPNVVNSSLTSVGTLAAGAIPFSLLTGVPVIPIAGGGTGQTTAPAAINALLPTQAGQGGNYLTTNGTVASWAAAPSSGGGGTAGNPTAVVGLTAVNGAATTFMRSDAAPPISQAIVPNWSALHTFGASIAVGGAVRGIDATGTDQAAAQFKLIAGRGTGTGTSSLIVQTSPPAAASGAALNAAATMFEVTTAGFVNIGDQAAVYKAVGGWVPPVQIFTGSGISGSGFHLRPDSLASNINSNNAFQIKGTDNVMTFMITGSGCILGNNGARALLALTNAGGTNNPTVSCLTSSPSAGVLGYAATVTATPIPVLTWDENKNVTVAGPIRGTDAAGTDQTASALQLIAGRGTGTGGSSLQIQTSPPGATGAGLNTPATMFEVTTGGQVNIGDQSRAFAAQNSGNGFPVIAYVGTGGGGSGFTIQSSVAIGGSNSGGVFVIKGGLDAVPAQLSITGSGCIQPNNADKPAIRFIGSGGTNKPTISCITTSATGVLGTSADAVTAPAQTLLWDANMITFGDGKNISVSSGTGTKIAISTAQKLGFWGAAPVAQQVDGAALVNSVTVGGTTNTIADFTSLSVYATDAATIRNNIYQLARKLKIMNDAMRLMGLLN